MKTNLTKILKHVIEDKYFTISLLIFLLIVMTYLVITGFSIKPSERQVISHYSAFGMTHFYFDQWFYLFSFIFFGVLLTIFNSFIAIKIHLEKGRSLAMSYLVISIGIIFLCWSTASTVMSLRNLL